MTRINSNIAALRGLHSVQNANNLLGTSLTRLSTGLKINSGKDNPSGLIASETLRSQITAIDQSISNSNRANNVIATADSSLGEVGGLLNQIRGLVQEGLNSGALSQSERDANQQQIDAALSAINRISANTTFAGDKLLDGSKAFTTSVASADAAKLSDFQINEATFGSSPTIQINASVVTAASKGTLKYAGGTLSQSATIEVAGSKGSQVLFLGAASSATNIRDAVNSVSDVTGVQATVTNSAPGTLEVTNATAGTLASQNSTKGTLDVTTAGTIDITRNARAGFKQFTSQEGDAVFKFTDARATSTVGDAAQLGGQIKVALVDTGTTLANAAVAGVAVDSSGNYTVTINVADDGAGNSTSNLADIQAAIAAHAGASALIAVTSTGTAAATDKIDFVAATQLTGGQNTTDNDITFTDVRPVANRDDYKVAVAFNAEAANQALAFSVDTNEFGDKTVNVTLATDAFGNVTSTADDIKSFLDTDVSAGAVAARALLSATTSGDGSGVVQANAAVALSDVTNSSLSFTDGRATDANAVFTNTLDVELLNGGASQTLSASFLANGDGGTLTINLATDANGVVTSTADDVKNYIANNVDADISGQFLVQASGDGSGVVGVAASDSLSAGVNGANNDLTFTDARATNSVGEFDETISVQFLNGGASQSLGVAVSQDSDGNKTVSINLATDANGVITSTADDVADFIANDASAGAVEARTLVNVAASGDGSGVLQAKGIAALTGGSNGANNDVTFTDVRTGSPTNAVNVAFADPGANSQALSVTTGVDINGDHLITVNLATDANGVITSTAADVADFIANDASADAVAARALVSAEASGDGTGVVAARSADALSASTGTEKVVFTSSNYGSREFVAVSVLSGSFATTLDDDTTAASRDNGSDIVAKVNGQLAVGDGLKASVKSATIDASLSFSEDHNIVDDEATVTITGGGSLFQIGQQVSAVGQIGIGIEAVNTARLGGISGKIYELGSGGGKSLLDVGPNVQGSDLVNIIDEAISRVATLRGRLGAIQKNVIETNISSLGAALENITEARSQITDTDFAEETAKLTKAQILSQASLSILSIANQNPNQVLSLLR